MKLCRSLTVSTRSARGIFARFSVLARFHLYPAAIQHFQDALGANPSSDEAIYDLASAYFQNHDDSQALQSLQQASADSKNDGAYLALLGDVYARLGRPGSAIEVLRKAILTSPNDDEYYLSLVLTQLHAANPEDAYTTHRNAGWLLFRILEFSIGRRSDPRRAGRRQAGRTLP